MTIARFAVCALLAACTNQPTGLAESRGDAGEIPAADENSGPLRSDPASIVLGDVFVGQTRVAPVLITNSGDSALTINMIAVAAINAITASESAFSHALSPTDPSAPTLPLTLAPGASTWLLVRFRPTQPGTAAAALTLESTAGDLTLPLSGTGAELGEVADVTSFGALGDGDSDDTAAFRLAAQTGKLLYVPAPPGGQHYKLSGRIDLSGPGVVGAPGAEKPTIKMYGATGYGGVPAPHVIFELDHYDAPTPAIFTGLHLDGGWDGIANVGEWAHLIQSRDSKRVIIENNLLENPMGDCVLLGGEGDLVPPSEQVVISNNVCRNPWRCSVALISARDIEIVANVLEKPNGHIVEGGSFYHFNIDFEPNPNSFDAVWGAKVAFNHVTSHVSHTPYASDNGIAIGLSHADTDIPPDGYAGGEIVIHDNTGSAQQAFFQPKMNTGAAELWKNVSAYRNANPNGCYPPWGDCP